MTPTLSKREWLVGMIAGGYVANKARPEHFHPEDDAAWIIRLADLLLQKMQSETPTAKPAYCRCSFTDADGTVVPGEPCVLHPEKKLRTVTPSPDPCQHEWENEHFNLKCVKCGERV